MESVNVVAQFGDWALGAALIFATFAACAAALGAKYQWNRLIASSCYATYLNAAFLSLATTLVLFSLLSNDFSVKYVYLTSDAAMPWFYKLTAYWGGLDGSILFWAWLLSLFSAIAIYQNRHRHPHLIPWVVVTLAGILIFFLILLLFYKRPFEVFLTKAPIQGRGLNPLLQDPYMAIHPPSLYIGYVSASIPFAFGISTLVTGHLDDAWIQSMRRWMLVCFYFLSQGLILGALWAYHVLGWGGYWNWDPVENAGLLPWFTATAFLHSIMIQERRGMMKTWNLVLVIVTFLLTLIGTFMTRSGIVQSVHAFGEDPTLAALFITLIGIVTAVSFGLLIHRLPLLRSRIELDTWASREFAFLCNNWVLLGAAFFVLIATLFPTLSEAIKQSRITVGAVFYNRWMGPLGLLLLFLTGAGPLFAFRRTSLRKLWEQFRLPLFGCLLTLVGAAVLFPKTRTSSEFLHTHLRIPTALLCIGLVAFVITSICQEFYQAIVARKRMTGFGFIPSSVGLLLRNRRRYGGYLVHIGISLMFLGFAGQPYQEEADFIFSKPGDEQTLQSYRIRYEGYQERSDTQKEQMQEVTLSVYSGDRFLGKMTPAKWTYRNHLDEPARTVVSIRAHLSSDLYIVFNGYDSSERRASIKVFVNPLVTWIWIGCALLLMGTVIAFLPEGLSLLSARIGPKTIVSVILAATTLISLSALASPDEILPNPMHEATSGEYFPSPARNQEERDLRKDLMCMCGCGRTTLADCTCAYAAKERALIAAMLDQGKTRDQIINYFLAKYPGEAVLAVPKDQGFNRLAWILPLLGFFLAFSMLCTLAFRVNRRKRLIVNHSNDKNDNLPLKSNPYESQLDEDLDDME